MKINDQAIKIINDHHTFCGPCWVDANTPGVTFNLTIPKASVADELKAYVLEIKRSGSPFSSFQHDGSDHYTVSLFGESASIWMQ